MLQVMPSKVDADGNFSVGRTWLFRYSIDGKERRMGLGPISKLRLEDARVEARALQKLVDAKIDPIEQREKEKQARQANAGRRAKTFDVVAEQYIKEHEPEWTVDYAVQWRRLLRMYAFPKIGNVPVAEISKHHILQCIKDDWRTHTATMKKVRTRIGLVCAFAVQFGYRPENLADPAAPAGFRLLLADPKKLDTRTQNRPALDYATMPEFMTLVRQTPGAVARALEFAVLTAAREEMVRGAVWSEINLTTSVWEIPASRMKSDRVHRVPLSKAAMAILLAIKGDATNPIGPVFYGRSQGKGVIQRNGLNRICQHIGNKLNPPQTITAHGTCRATFRTWGGEKTFFARELLEVALAHDLEGDATERAYQRGDLLDKRAQVMEAWGQYCGGSQGENIVPLRKSA
jgi:integrase